MKTNILTRLARVSTIAVAAAVSFTTTQAWSQQDGDIVIGFASANSGWLESYDKGALQAAMIAIDDINAKGGVLGRKIKAITADTKTDRARAAQVSQELLNQGAEILFVSCDYDFGSPGAIAAEAAGKVSWFFCAGDIKAGVQGVGPHSFSGSMLAVSEGATIADWAVEKKNIRRPYMLLDTTIQYDKSLCSGFEYQAKAAGAEIAGQDTFKNGDTSLASQITRIKSMNPQPDAVMLCSYLPGQASAMRQLRAAGIDLPLLSGVALDGDYWISSTPGLTDFYGLAKGSIRGDDPREPVNELVKKYTEKYGAPPVNQNVFDGYVGIELLAKAIEKAGSTDAAAMTAALESFHDEPTLLGERTFTSKIHNQTRPPFLITEVKDGKSAVIDQWRLKEELPDSVTIGQ